ncbi:MAG: hypothetical protein ACYCUM_13435 [Solirubrobacteraceae bacterium]
MSRASNSPRERAPPHTHSGRSSPSSSPSTCAGGGFRALFWAIVGLGGLALLFALLTAQMVLSQRTSPTHAAMLFWPEFGGAIASTFLFAFLFKTRAMPLFALVGMALIAAAVVMSGMAGDRTF